MMRAGHYKQSFVSMSDGFCFESRAHGDSGLKCWTMRFQPLTMPAPPSPAGPKTGLQLEQKKDPGGQKSINIPAQVSQLLVDSLQRHCSMLLMVEVCGRIFGSWWVVGGPRQETKGCPSI